VTLTQFEQRGWFDRTLKMQMELGLWQSADKAGRLGHAEILADRVIWRSGHRAI
jgi:hypothetical protein